MEKADLQEKRHLIQILILTCMSIFISVARCSKRKIPAQYREGEAQTVHV